MDIHLRKIQLIQDILRLQDEQILIGLESLLDKLWIERNDDIQPMSIEELNKRIDESEDDFRNDRFKDTQTLLSKYK